MNLGMVVQIFNPTALDVEAEGQRIWGWFLLNVKPVMGEDLSTLSSYKVSDNLPLLHSIESHVLNNPTWK